MYFNPNNLFSLARTWLGRLVSALIIGFGTYQITTIYYEFTHRPRPYEPAAWTASPTWTELHFDPGAPHHYAYSYDSSGTGSMAAFTASAFGDLDGDGRYSTFARIGWAYQGTCSDSWETRNPKLNATRGLIQVNPLD